MTNAKIIGVFVGLSVLIWICFSGMIFAMLKLGFGPYVKFAFKFYPTLILVSALPVAAMYVKATTAPMPYKRAIMLACLSLVILLPLTVLADSLNAAALINGMGIPDPEGGRNYIIYTHRAFTLTAVAVLAGLGFIFPAQIRAKRQRNA